MPVNKENYKNISAEVAASGATLVAVSKTKPESDIRELYELGQRDFGENYVQELAEKAGSLPADIRWHFIGHLQTNKVKTIAPFVHLIHGVDSLKLLQEINKQGSRVNRVIDCLLQVYIATEETKFGLDKTELDDLLRQIHRAPFPNVRIRGLMGMASFTGEVSHIRDEFRHLKKLFDDHFANDPDAVLSMGMSGDYTIAIAEGSNMVRIGSALFGARDYNK